MVRSTASRRARNSASVRMGARRRPESRPSRRRWRLASRRVDPRTPRTPSPLSSSASRARLSRTWTTVSGGSSSDRPAASSPLSAARRRRRRRRGDAVDVPASAVSGDSASSSGVLVVSGRGLARRCAVRRLGGLRDLVSVSTPTTPSASAPPPPGASRLLGGDLANLFWLVDHGLRRLEGPPSSGAGCSAGATAAASSTAPAWAVALVARRRRRGARLRCVRRCDEQHAGRDHRRGDGVDRVGGDLGGRSGRGRGKGLRRRDGFGGGLLRRTAPGRPGRRGLCAAELLRCPRRAWVRGRTASLRAVRRRGVRAGASSLPADSGASRRLRRRRFRLSSDLSFGADSGASAVPAAFLARLRARGALTVGAGGRTQARSVQGCQVRASARSLRSASGRATHGRHCGRTEAV